MSRLTPMVAAILAVLSMAVVGLTAPRADGARSANAPPWPVLLQDPSHRGRSPFVAANPGWKKWEFLNAGDGWSNGSPFSAPVIGPGGTVYVASDNLYALNPDGKLKWKLEIDDNANTAPAIGPDGTIYVGGASACLTAVSPDGVVMWKLSTSACGYTDRIAAPVVGPDGTIYFGAIHPIYKSNQVNEAFPIETTVALCAVTPDGKLKWKLPVVGSINSPPAVHDGTIYFGSGDHNLYALNSDGLLKWKFATGSQVHGAPAIGADGVIYFGSDDHYVYAVNPDGSLRWKFKAGDAVDSAPAIGTNGTIYFGSWDGFLYALTPDGKLKWKFAADNDLFAPPAIGGDGVIYVGSSSENGKLYAVSPAGKLEWTFATYGPLLEPLAIGADGMVYASTYFSPIQHGGCGTLYAIGKGKPGAAATDKPNPITLGDESLKLGALKVPSDWKLYHNPATGLTFRYPPYVTLEEVDARKLEPPYPFLRPPETVVSQENLFYGGRKSDDRESLLSIGLFEHLTSDQTVSDRRGYGGCGYEHHFEVNGNLADACVDCTGVCWWNINFYAPGRKLQIDLMPDADKFWTWPVAGLDKRRTQLTVISSVHLDAPSNGLRKIP